MPSLYPVAVIRIFILFSINPSLLYGILSGYGENIRLPPIPLAYRSRFLGFAELDLLALMIYDIFPLAPVIWVPGAYFRVRGLCFNVESFCGATVRVNLYGVNMVPSPAHLECAPQDFSKLFSGIILFYFEANVASPGIFGKIQVLALSMYCSRDQAISGSVWGLITCALKLISCSINPVYCSFRIGVEFA